MPENERGEVEPRGKFASRRDEALYVMSLQGWANESSGDVQAPTGWFAKVSITPHELSEVAEAFEEDLEQIGLENSDELIGHFLLTEDNQGFFEVITYDNPLELARHYTILEEAFTEWESEL